MPSHSSCDCAHACMNLSQALAQVQIHQSHCFHKNQAEEKRGGLMERQTGRLHGLWRTEFCLLTTIVMKLTVRFKQSKNISKTSPLLMITLSLLRSEGKILNFVWWDQRQVVRPKAFALKRNSKHAWCYQGLFFFIISLLKNPHLVSRCIDQLVVIVLGH